MKIHQKKGPKEGKQVKDRRKDKRLYNPKTESPEYFTQPNILAGVDGLLEEQELNQPVEDINPSRINRSCERVRRGLASALPRGLRLLKGRGGLRAKALFIMWLTCPDFSFI